MRMLASVARKTLTCGLVVAAMVAAHAIDISALKGRWVLEAVDGRTIAPDRGEIYLEITEQTISGFDGCNRFGISVAQPLQGLRGQRGCPPGAVLLPLDLANPMSQLSRATVRGDKLYLPLPEGRGEGQFRRSR
jgi:hypothetical protein